MRSNTELDMGWKLKLTSSRCDSVQPKKFTGKRVYRLPSRYTRQFFSRYAVVCLA